MNRSASAWLFGLALAIALSSASAVARATESGPRAPEPVALPQQAACTLRAKRVTSEVRLELAPGIPYAAVTGVQAIEVLLPVADAPAPVGVKLKRGRFALEGLVAAGAIPLHPRRALVVADVLATTPLSTLRWTDATASDIGVELALSDDIRKMLDGFAAPLRARLECADLDLESRSFDMFRAIGLNGRGVEGRFDLSARVPLSLKPGGPPVLTVVADSAVPESPRVFARKPGWARIALTRNEVAIFGWVPAAFVLRPVKGGEAADIYDIGGLGLSGLGTPRLKATVSCNHDVPLVAEAGGQRRLVGTIGAGVAIQLLSDDAAYVPVRFEGLDPVEGARFLVERTAFARCTTDAP
jgi:hypothetical protein